MVVGGGGDLKTSLAACRQRATGIGAIEIYNEYGPTEAVRGMRGAHRYDPGRIPGPAFPSACQPITVRVDNPAKRRAACPV